VDQRIIEPPVDLAPKATDMNIDDVRLGIEMVIPDFLEEHGSGDDLSVVTHEVFEETKLARLEVDYAAAAANLPGEQIHFQIAQLKASFGSLSVTASDQRLEPGEKLRKGKGLDEVIITTLSQTLDPVVDLT
jgi:hypothetical protein